VRPLRPSTPVEAARFHAPGRPDEEERGQAAVARAAEWVRAGGILAHPTSTVYGLGGRPVAGVDRAIAAAKGRDAGRPLLRVAASRAAVEALARRPWPPGADALADAFWPGPLTLVLPDGTAGTAVRVDAHPVLRALLETLGEPMSSTSLNRSGEPPVREAGVAREWVEAAAAAGHVVALLEAGDLPASPSSTIVSLTGPEPTLIREGAIGWTRVREALAADESAENGAR